MASASLRPLVARSAARIRWRLNRLFERGNRSEDLFDAACAERLRRGEARPFVYLPWVPSHGDALMRLLDPEQRLLVPLPLFRSPEQLRQRRMINAFVVDKPVAYRQLLLNVLEPLRGRSAGLVTTLDWPPAMRQAVYACRELGIPSVLIPHEAIFADRQRYYQDRLTGADAPICDRVLCWGELQRAIFLERGVAAERLQIVGSPKLDGALGFQPSSSRSNFCRAYGFDEHKPIVLFAMQPLDSQYDSEAARQAQSCIVADLMELCGERSAQLLVRCPPSGHQVLPHGLVQQIEQSRHARLDKAPYLSAPHESIHHALCVCSINSTMLLEALIMKRFSIAARYLSFENLWAEGGIRAAHHKGELSLALDDALAGRMEAQEPGLQWAARAFSVGRFDGQSAARIRAELAELAASPRPVAQDPVEELFSRPAGAVPHGTAAFAEPVSAEARILSVALGFRRALFAPDQRTAQVADVFVTRTADQRARCRQLGRPQLFVEGGPPLPGLTPDASVSSFLLDSLAPPSDVRTASRLEGRLNSDQQLSDSQLARAERCLRQLGFPPQPQVAVSADAPLLLIDEWRCEPSAVGSAAHRASFRRMLEQALEQPRPVVVQRRRHPLLGVQAGFYDDRLLREYRCGQLQVLESEHTERLFHGCAEVWVVASPLGLPALCAGLPVRCFGTPFFAGWGLTRDMQKVPRRRRSRALLELFYVAYLESSKYYSHAQNRPCELEEAIGLQRAATQGESQT